MDPEARAYQHPWRGVLLSASVGYLAFWPLLIFAQGLVERERWGSIPAFFAHLSGALGMGLLIAVLGVVMLIGLGFWFGAVIAARALLQAAESWKAHAVMVFVIGGGLIGLALGAVALMLGVGAEIGNGELTLAVGLIDGLMAAAVLQATAGRWRPIDTNAVF